MILFILILSFAAGISVDWLAAKMIVRLSNSGFEKNINTSSKIRFGIVESLIIGLTLTAYCNLGWTLDFGVACFLIWSGALVVIIDLMYQIIPNKLSAITALAGLTYVVGQSLIFGKISLLPIISVLIGGGFIFLLTVVSSMGGGDLKYMTGVSLFLTPSLTAVALFIAFMLGGTASVILMAFKGARKGSKIAFGPFLVIGVCISYILGQDLLELYLGWIQY